MTQQIAEAEYTQLSTLSENRNKTSLKMRYLSLFLQDSINLQLISYRNVPQIANKIVATQRSFIDQLKHKIVKTPNCRMPSSNPHHI